jgi:hypothetical protein
MRFMGFYFTDFDFKQGFSWAGGAGGAAGIMGKWAFIMLKIG